MGRLWLTKFTLIHNFPRTEKGSLKVLPTYWVGFYKLLIISEPPNSSFVTKEQYYYLQRVFTFVRNHLKWKWSCSVVSNSVTPWTVAHQASLSMGFSRQGSWSGLPFPSQEIFQTQELNLGLPHYRQMLYPLSHQGILDNAKECSNYRTIALISHASKVMLKILQARLQQYVNFQMFKLVLEKAEEPEIKLPTSAGSPKKQESSRKTSISVLLTLPKPLTV